jgi:hypothetical protein
MAMNASDDGAQRRQVDVVVGRDLRLVGGAEYGGAVRTGGKRGLNDPVRMCGQSTSNARTAATGLLRAVREVRCLTLDGGMLELPGVLAGAASWASNAAIRTVKLLIC